MVVVEEEEEEEAGVVAGVAAEDITVVIRITLMVIVVEVVVIAQEVEVTGKKNFLNKIRLHLFFAQLNGWHNKTQCFGFNSKVKLEPKKNCLWSFFCKCLNQTKNILILLNR